MSRELSLQNRQRTRAVDLRFLRRITNNLLTELLSLDDFELGIHLIATAEMARLNETRKITFIFSSHDPLVLSRAKRVVHLHDGQIKGDL